MGDADDFIAQLTPLSLANRRRNGLNRITHSGVRSRFEAERDLKNSNEFEGKFKATALWNRMLEDFRDNMPLKKHRRQLSFFDDSFTGKEAVDFLMEFLPKYAPEGKQITRINCINLLQKYLEAGIFKRPRMQNEKDIFRENATLYVFCDSIPFAGSRTPTLLRRSNSFCGSADRTLRSATQPKHGVTPVSWSKPIDESLGIKVMTPEEYQALPPSPRWGEFKKFELPRSPIKHTGNFNRRLSSSHGNLLSITGNQTSGANITTITRVQVDPEATSLAETEDSVGAEVDYRIGNTTYSCTDKFNQNPSKLPPAHMIPLHQTDFTTSTNPGVIKNKTFTSATNRSCMVNNDCSLYDSDKFARYRSSCLAGSAYHPKIIHPKKKPLDAAAHWGISLEEEAPQTFLEGRDDKENVIQKSHNTVVEERECDYGYGEFTKSSRSKFATPRTPSVLNMFSRSGGEKSVKSKSSKTPQKPIRTSTPSSFALSKSPDYAPLNVVHRYVTEIDLWNIWAQCLISRLKRLLGVDELAFLTWSLNGQDIRWNCEKVGTSGVVKPNNREDDVVSSHIVKMIRFLVQFPFPTGSGNVIKYEDNQEVKIFKTLCSHLAQDTPPLNYDVAKAILAVINHFQKRSNQMNNGKLTVDSTIRPIKETEFSALTTATTTTLLTVKEDVSDAISGSRKTVFGHTNTAFSDDVSPLKGTQNTKLLLSAIDYHRVLHLPGLVHSPEVMDKINRLMENSPVTSTPDKDSLPSLTSPLPFPIFDSPEGNGNQTASTPDETTIYGNIPARTTGDEDETTIYGSIPSRTARTRLSISSRMSKSPFIHNISPALEEPLLEAVCLLLLSLPTVRRRRLHWLIRQMAKLISNHCLSLDPPRENLPVILESLSECVIECTGENLITPIQCHHLTAFLMDYEKILFAIPEGLRSDVEMAVRERRRDKVVVLGSSEKQLQEKEDSEKAYCERIKISDYEAQKSQLDRNIANLLDQIVHDPNLDAEYKKKKLKKFKKMYPEVYASRFPNEVESKTKENPSLLQRLFRVKN